MNTETFMVGDKVQIKNVDLESFGAVGEVIAVNSKTVKVKLMHNFPAYWNARRITHYSQNSLELMPRAKTKSTNIALFFTERKDAVNFLEVGSFYSEDGNVDMVSVETLRDCEYFYENTASMDDIEYLVFKGILYQVKPAVRFIEEGDE